MAPNCASIGMVRHSVSAIRFGLTCSIDPTLVDDKAGNCGTGVSTDGRVLVYPP